MKSITIKGSKRESVGKVSTKALRNAEKVPCVLYGGDTVVHFSADELAFKKLVYTPEAHTVVIELEGQKPINAIMQDIQFHPVTDKILHIDFYQLYDDKEITMTIPVRVEGTSPGVLAGGVLRVSNRKLRVKSLPSNLPDFIKVNISELEIGDKLYVNELSTEDFSFQHAKNTVVCQVRTARAAVKEESEETTEQVAEAGAEVGAEGTEDKKEGNS